MGIFDLPATKKEFDAFTDQTDEKIRQLKHAIETKISDSEETIHAAAEVASQFLVTLKEREVFVENSLEILKTCQDQASDGLTKIRTVVSNVEATQAELEGVLNKITEIQEEANETNGEIHTFSVEAENKLTQIRQTIEACSTLPDSIEETKEYLKISKQLNDDIQTLRDHSVKRKGEVDELHKAIFGQNITSTDGQEEHVAGLKDQLETSYREISSQVNKLTSNVKSLTDSITDEFKQKQQAQFDEFQLLLTDSKLQITNITNEINHLLPGGLAAGLSSAYEKKKNDEVNSLQVSETGFKNAIWGLIAVSLIPFCVDVYLLGWQNNDLLQVIKNTPNLIVSIFPIYFPILWFAYSANKKINLSKRLIEEYTHKEVLGKTFSGLSNQVDSLNHGDSVKNELRTRLLFNLLQVSAENPGKLITDYNKADHPLMEALENSSKLSDSMEKVAKIPGLSALAKKIMMGNEKVLSTQKQKIAKGLEMQEVIESSSSKVTEAL
jgi:hypothetical protein